MDNYTIEYLIELLEDLKPQVQYLRTQSSEGVTCMVYQGVRGNAVFIDTTDLLEPVDSEVIKGHLDELGLAYLISNIFPEKHLLN